MSRREKITQSIKKEISLILHGELKDPRLGFITVTGVELTDDFRYAKVFFNVLGTEDDYRKTKEALASALGFIKRSVAKRLGLRFAVDLSFHEDRSSEYSMRIEQLLQEIKGLNEPPKGNKQHKKK